MQAKGCSETCTFLGAGISAPDPLPIISALEPIVDATQWLDWHYRTGWTANAAESMPLKCLSVGWLEEDGERAKLLSENQTSKDQPQRCGDMTIPAATLTSLVEVMK